MYFPNARKVIADRAATGIVEPVTKDDVEAAHTMLAFRRSEPLGAFADVPDVAAFTIMLAASSNVGRTALAALAVYYITETYRTRRTLTNFLLPTEHTPSPAGNANKAVVALFAMMVLVTIMAGAALGLSVLWPLSLRLLGAWGLYRTVRDAVRKHRENATCEAILAAGRTEPWYLGWLAATDRAEAERREQTYTLWGKQPT